MKESIDEATEESSVSNTSSPEIIAEPETEQTPEEKPKKVTRRAKRRTKETNPANEREVEAIQMKDGSVKVTFCPHCGKQVNLGENPCRHCGNLIGYPELKEDPEWMVCPKCNYTEPARFFNGACKHCGYKGD